MSPDAPDSSPLDLAAKKAVLRLYTYGLYIVTCAHEGETNAFTANWLTQVSFQPPLIALSVENASVSLSLIEASGFFTVCPLREDQRELAGALGRSKAKAGDKLARLGHHLSPRGLPLLDEGVLGHVECRVVGRTPAGDSTLFVGEAVGAALEAEGMPLTMGAAGFRHSG